MIIKSTDVRKAVKAVWPKLRFIVLSDPEWWLPSENELREKIAEAAVDRFTFVPHLFECEEFSKMLYAAIPSRRADLAASGLLPKSEWRNYPLGLVCGTKFRGIDQDHWINLCLTQQGLRLIEPQTGEMWAPVPGEDEIYFLLM